MLIKTVKGELEVRADWQSSTQLTTQFVSAERKSSKPKLHLREQTKTQAS